ncbi:hypothetical protein KJ641_03045 [Patescibacteria group bacterium]|nr:hypothetical protein [Patescibacteria group bacterium]MBU1895819.1 hypothetical protein [Patescibacteria group bacterium]
MPKITSQNLLKGKESINPEIQPIESTPIEAKELPPTPEVASDVLAEQKDASQPSIETTERINKSTKRSFSASVKMPQAKDEITLKIENIMSQNLEEEYKKMSIVDQQEFKLKGEETASKIRLLMKGTHTKVKKIFKLLVSWLKMLPGVNRFFLEQEAKIKTDKILGLKKIENLKKGK